MQQSRLGRAQRRRLFTITNAARVNSRRSVLIARASDVGQFIGCTDSDLQLHSLQLCRGKEDGLDFHSFIFTAISLIAKLDAPSGRGRFPALL
jgi:hypothetical protein